jgi:hypothetical protein
MRWYTKPALAGVILAGLTAPFIFLLPRQTGLYVLGILLTAMAGYYVWIAIWVRDRTLFTIEMIVTVLFVVMALSGIRYNPNILALGYVILGLWTLAHHPRFLRSPGPWWVQPLFLSFGWIVTVVIVVRF